MTKKNILQLLVVCSVLLVIATYFPPKTKGFYDILRITVCGTFAIISYNQIKTKSLNLLNIAIAILYNPFTSIGFKRDNWELVNAATLLYCVCIFIIYYKEQSQFDYKKQSPSVNKLTDIKEQVGAFLKMLDIVCEDDGIKQEFDKTISSIMSDVIVSSWRLYRKGESPKLKLNDNVKDVFICEHSFNEDNKENEAREKYTLKEIYTMFNGEIYPMVYFIIGEGSYKINMSAFNEHILPQLKEAISRDMYTIARSAQK